MARFVWTGIGEALGWAGWPISWEDWCVSWVPIKCKLPNRLGRLLFACLAWVLWTNRNKMAIEHNFPNSCIQLFHAGISFLQRWIPLSKASDRDKARQLTERLKSWAMGFLPATSDVSDIGFI